MKDVKEIFDFFGNVNWDFERIPVVVKDERGEEHSIASIDVQWEGRMTKCRLVLTTPATICATYAGQVEAALEQQSETMEEDYSHWCRPNNWRMGSVPGSDHCYNVYYRECRVGRIEMVRGDFDFNPNRTSEYTAVTCRKPGEIIDALEAQRLERTTSCE